MSLITRLVSRTLGLFRRRRTEDGLSDEIRFHLDMQIEDNLTAGMDPAEARFAALRSFGGLEPMKEQYRDQSAFMWMETTLQDLRYAARTLLRNPAFSIASIVVLGLAIGSNTAMFSVLNAVLLRPLPYHQPDRLAMLWREDPGQGIREGRSAIGSVEQLRTQTRTFEDLAAFDPVSATLATGTGVQHISVARISPNFFVLLGVQPSLGRIFTAREADERQRLVVISHRMWQSTFAGADSAIGASIDLDGRPSRVIGVIPASFHFPNADAALWEPNTLAPDFDASRRDQRGTGSWFVLGRIREDATILQAQAEMNTIAQRLDSGEGPATDTRNLGIAVVPLSVQLTGSKARLALWLLSGAVLCMLLVAAANVASLSLARGANREREMSVRAALGASRSRIGRQLIVESLLLACISGVLGLVVAIAGIRIVLNFNSGELFRIGEAALNLRELAWTFGLCLVTGVLVGFLPAFAIARRSLRPLGQIGSARGVAGGVSSQRIRRVLVVAQFGLSIVLLVGAGLLIRSLRSAESVDLGFRAKGVMTMQIASPPSLSPERQAQFFHQVLEQIRSLPGVDSVGLIGNFFVGGNPERELTTEAGDAFSASRQLRFRLDEVDTGFFQTVGTPLLRGRFFSEQDGAGSTRVVIVNEAMAKQVWPSRDAVGQRCKFTPAAIESPWYTVVGIVGDMRRQGLEVSPIPQAFEPVTQNPSRLAEIVVRTSVPDPLTLVGSLQAAVARVDNKIPLYGVSTMENRLRDYLGQRRFQTVLLLGFSALSLLMAAVGIYGLIQYSIAVRTPELGIRLALGAKSGEVFRMIMAEGLRLSLAGLLVGLIGAFWLAQMASSLLFGVTATDPLTFVAVSLLLTLVAAVASFGPARRAMRIDPIVALRRD